MSYQGRHVIAESEADLDAIAELSGVMQLLKGYIIAPQYGVAEDLVSPIVLTEFGVHIRDRLRTEHRRTRPAEATLAVALRIGVGDYLMLDPHQTKLDEIRSGISPDIAQKRLLFPDPYRRETAEELFASHQYNPQVSNSDSLKVFRDLEPGVYQVARSTVGPWGCLESVASRTLEPSRRIFGYRCENAWCTRVHPFYLETAQNARINKAQEDLTSIVEPYQSHAPVKSVKAFRLRAARAESQDPLIDSAQLLNFLGDALTDQERVEFAAMLLKRLLKSDPTARRRLSTVSSRMLGNPHEFAEQLTFGELMQLFYLSSDEQLIMSVDEGVASGSIRTDAGLRRTARISRWRNSSLTAEVGVHGLRFNARQDQENLVLGHVLYRVYSENPEDLAYALDRRIDEPLDSLISHAFQSMPADEVAEKCLINHRSAASKACALFHIDVTDRGRLELTQLLKWRLGISEELEASQSGSITAAIDNYLAASSDRGERAKRGDLSNIFVAIETELMLAIKFAAWALGEDHYTQPSPFVFRGSDLPSASRFLLDKDGSEVEEKPSLQSLASSFGRLANWLEDLPLVARDQDALPISTLVSGRPFAFPHIGIFHDLTKELQGLLLSGLRDATRDFGNSDVLAVRNTGPGHGNNEFPDDTQIRGALTRARNGLQALAENGLTPIAYNRVGTSRGLRGQMEATYRSWAGEATIRSPYWPIAPGLPGLVASLLVIPSASGAGWGYLRFRMQSGDRGGPQWDSWPPRRVSEQASGWEQASQDARAPADEESLPA